MIRIVLRDSLAIIRVPTRCWVALMLIYKHSPGDIKYSPLARGWCRTVGQIEADCKQSSVSLPDPPDLPTGTSVSLP